MATRERNNTAAALSLLVAVAAALGSLWIPAPWDIAAVCVAALAAGWALLLFVVALTAPEPADRWHHSD